jgi:uncharacterized RDD family membrane protein YckC
VEASAAQKRPVTKTCLQCGAVQPSSVRACNFCDSLIAGEQPHQVESHPARASASPGPEASLSRDQAASSSASDGGAWRGELNQRLQAYRTRRRKVTPNLGQSNLPFEDVPVQHMREQAHVQPAIAVSENLAPTPDEDFSFTIAIGRNAATRQEPRMFIDVSLAPEFEKRTEQLNEQRNERQPSVEAHSEQAGLYPVASIEERRLAGLIDAGFLLFAYGGFLTLFGSLGGEFTLSKLSAAVCVTTFVFVYLQYFALFTVFGGTTPGMMLRGLHVASFSGEPPTPRQMLWRSAGYMLSAGTFFLGFLWAIWDEDALTWHDRLSRTYLCPAPTLADLDATHVAHSR